MPYGPDKIWKRPKFSATKKKLIEKELLDA
jgi:hypothetical protein